MSVSDRAHRHAAQRSGAAGADAGCVVRGAGAGAWPCARGTHGRLHGAVFSIADRHSTLFAAITGGMICEHTTATQAIPLSRTQ